MIEHPDRRYLADAAIERAIIHLHYGYADCLDAGSYEEWPDFFIDEGRYVIHPRENADAGLDGGYWIYCTNKRMLRDRVLALREVNVYDIHFDRHLVSNIRILGYENDVYRVRANYLVVQTSAEGRSAVQSTGEYHDEVVWVDGLPKFKQRRVIPDTFNTDKIVAVPL